MAFDPTFGPSGRPLPDISAAVTQLCADAETLIPKAAAVLENADKLLVNLNTTALSLAAIAAWVEALIPKPKEVNP
jgi:hypothetical protein